MQTFATILGVVSAYITPAICVCGVGHIVVLLWLNNSRSKQIKGLASSLSSVTRKLGTGPSAISMMEEDETIEAHCEEIFRVLKGGKDKSTLESINKEVDVFNKIRPDKQTYRTERLYYIARTMIEAYPLLGIIGTVMAIAAVLGSTPTNHTDKHMQPDAVVNEHTAQEGVAVSAISSEDGVDKSNELIGALLDSFGVALHSTIAGLFFAITLMALNSYFEPLFTRLEEHRKRITDVIHWAMKEGVSIGSEPQND